MEFSAGEANAYLSGKYLTSYVVKGYVYRVGGNCILVDLDVYDLLSVNYEEEVYVRINGLYKLWTNNNDAELIHENDIEEWDNIVTVKELKELEKLLSKTEVIVYGKVKSSKTVDSLYSDTYYWATLSSTKMDISWRSS